MNYEVLYMDFNNLTFMDFLNEQLFTLHVYSKSAAFWLENNAFVLWVNDNYTVSSQGN